MIVVTPCRTGVLRLVHSTRRVPPLIVEPHEGPYRASLTNTPDGIVVRLSRNDRPPGQRLIGVETIDAPMHVIASRMYDELARLNRGAAR